MKQIIKIRRKAATVKVNVCGKVIEKTVKTPLPKIIPEGEWIDLYACGDYKYKKGEFITIDLGIAVEMPLGMEAPIISRSSTCKNFGIILVNAEGLIDNPFKGNDNWWKYFAYALKDGEIKHGQRIAQFRIQLSQKATVMQKLKWLLSSGIEIKEVDNLTSPNRGDSGSTGK